MIEKVIIVYVLALLGYLILTTYIIPTYVYGVCSYADQIPSEAVVDLSLNSWMLGNFISGLPLYSIVCSVIEIKACQDCLAYVFIILGALYTLFQNIWTIIGFLIFNDHYRNSCASAGSFNVYIDAAVYYGIVLFPLTTIIAILVAIFKCTKDNPNIEVEVGSQPIIQNNYIADNAYQNGSD